MAVQRKAPFNVFYCFATEDRLLQGKLDEQLQVLKTRGWIQSWQEDEIPIGRDRMDEVEQHLHNADIILLLLSPNFFVSESCCFQMNQAIQRYKAKEALVIPVVLRPVNWQTDHFLRELYVLPEDGSPITMSKNRDAAFLHVANGIQAIVTVLLKGIYIVSAPEDATRAYHLQQDLETRKIVVWRAPERRGLSKADHEKMVQQMIRASRMILFVVSPYARYNRILHEYLRIAHLYQKQVVSLWIAGHSWQEAAPRSFVQNLYIDARALDEETILTRIESQYTRVAALDDKSEDIFNVPFPSHPVIPTESRNPYKALRSFSEDDVRDFFGREALTNELVETLKEGLTSQQNNEHRTSLLAVVGASGVGKSSVVLAGLLPRLQGDTRFKSNEWIYLKPMVPGTHPIESLALILSDYMPAESIKVIQDDLMVGEARGLYWQAFKLVKSPERKVILVVDQFEELFTQVSEDERQHFIDLLVVAATEPQSPVIVIITLRADFYDRPMKYPELSELIQSHLKIVPPMEVEDLRAVIEEPAALPDVQLIFDDYLVGDLLFETRGQVGALPLLEFALDQLFQRRQGNRLTRKAYEEMGGVRGALSRRAEEIYAALPSNEHRRLSCRLFLRLVDPGFTEQDTTRRRAVLSEFDLAEASEKQQMRETLEAFIRARLLTTSQIRDRTTVEVSHEAVIREWKRLEEWLREAREDIHFQQSLSKDVTEWDLHKRSRDRLYRGAQFKEARAWAKRNTPSQQEMTFLRASAAQRIRSFVSLIAISLLLFSMSGVAGWYLFLQPKATLVTTLQDTGAGSLRWCVANAPSGSTIRFEPGMAGIIELTRGDLTFESGKQLTLVGLGTKRLAISGSDDAHIHVPRKATLTISSLSFKGSQTLTNAFLYNEGTLIVADSIISNNKNSSSGSGGGIYNTISGILTVTNSTISDNSTQGTGLGGGIFNSGTMTLTNSTVSGNSAQGIGDGGGIFNDGTMTLTNSTVSGNSAQGHNANSYSDGGGIYNTGTTTLINSTVSGNTIEGDGDGAPAGGGIYNDLLGTMTLINSTVSSNSAQRNRSIGRGGNGGGIFNYGGTLRLTFCTLYGNSAMGEGNDILTIKVANTSSPILAYATAQNSIFAGKQTATNQDVAGDLTSLGYNLIPHKPEARVKLQSTDQIGDPKLDPMLRSNGGPTKTHALLPNGATINAIPLADCHITVNKVLITTDQRGVKRPQGAGCDIGAFESVL